jgi:CheY-like chemotaxis protein
MASSKIVRRASIFLLEDDAIIRMMLVGMLEELGHRVIAEAGSLRDAEALAQTADFDLALLDINIAGDNVAPVAAIVVQRGLPLLFVTGYVASALPQGFEDRPMIQKPFVLSNLAVAIELALKGRGQS